MDDPDELRYQHAIRHKDPEMANKMLESIDWRLQYGIPELRFVGWVIVVLLSLILWRVWT